MKNWRIEAIILAVGLSLAGVFVRNGLSEFSSRSRVVTVKGLAENGSKKPIRLRGR